MITKINFLKAVAAFILFFLFFGLFTILSAAAGLFYTQTVFLSIVLSGILAAYFSSRTKLKDENRYGGIAALVVLISLLISFATCYFATPSIFGGRDQGAISTAAIFLSSNHELKFQTPESADLFKEYGIGKALNYPGFDYGSDGLLQSRFPLGFTSVLAGYFSLFGLKGIQYANFAYLALFFIIFWLTLRQFFSKTVSLLGYLLAISFFPFLWFAKFSLTETYSLFLIWTGIYFLLKGLSLKSEKSELWMYFSLMAFSLSALTRIEGIVFFSLAAFYIVYLSRKKAIALPRNFLTHLSLIGFFLVILYAYLNFPTLMDSLKNFAKVLLPSFGKDSTPSANLYLRLLELLITYNFLIYLVTGASGIILMAINLRKNITKTIIIPFVILFPSLLYLILPLISLDDPWMFRRYSFAVFPLLMFYSIYALDRFFRHKFLLYFVLAALILANGFISFRFVTMKENSDLLAQVKNLSAEYRNNDLILVDRLASGSGYSLLSEPLSSVYGKNAVYFFNADDLKAINQARYKNIYLIAPITKEKTWYSALVENKEFKYLPITNNFFEPASKQYSLAEEQYTSTDNGIWRIK